MSQCGLDTRSQFIDYLRGVDTPTLSNAIELLRVRERNEGFAPFQIRCLFPELGRMVGHAVTAQVETMTTASGDRSMFPPLYEAVEKCAKPVVVAFQEVGPKPQYAAHCGEVMATIFKRLGAVGLITDCAVRDIPEVRALRFHYFAQGAVASHGFFRILRVGVPIQIAGWDIRSGDLLHGDENGAIVVPNADIEALQSAVDAVRERERRLIEFVNSPQLTFPGLRKHVLE
jgi:regulator of RNase E activity RraA